MELKIITGEKLKKDERIYTFTNENISSYRKIFDFEEKDVLSVIGSGDQYFASLLYGAESVDIFDFNLITIYYFILKFEAIKILSYDDFMEFFIKSELKKISIYERLRSVLPRDVREFFDSKLIFGDGLYYKKIDGIDITDMNVYTGRVIPYFEKNEYYRLKRILKEISYPRFYLTNLKELYKFLDKKYDIMLFSNIRNWCCESEEGFIKFLKSQYYPYLKEDGVIQADYWWFINYHTANYGEVTEIDCSEYGKSEFSKDYVLSLRK